MEKRTKILVAIAALLAVIVAGYYAYRFFLQKKPAAGKIAVTMGKPIPKGKAAKAKAPAKPAAPLKLAGKAAEKQAASGQLEIKVTEKGKEVAYKSPEEFVSRTGLSQAELAAYCAKRLDDAQKALKAAQAKGDAAAVDAAKKEVDTAQKLASLAEKKASGVSVAAGPERKLYAYAAMGKRDPFMNPLEIPKVYPPVPPNAKPLEKVPVETLKVKAIVWNRKGYRALVGTPDGRAYTVRKGDRIGDKLGRVTDISRNRLVVTEDIRDLLGDVEVRKTVIDLYK